VTDFEKNKSPVRFENFKVRAYTNFVLRFVAEQPNLQNMYGKSDVQPTNLSREGEKIFSPSPQQPEQEGCE
jgi:hypothetical protein